MINWSFNPAEYTENSFSVIPAGDHRVRIEDAVAKQSKAGNDMIELTLAVSGHSGKLWHYLVLDRNDVAKTNQRIGAFFDSFGIVDPDVSHFRAWIGKVGAVRVKHEEYNSETQAKVAFCLSKNNQSKLPPAQFKDAANVTAGATAGYAPVADIDELPFD